MKVLSTLCPLLLMLSISCGADMTLFDFTTGSPDFSTWKEVSDTVRKPGMSKAVLALQKTRVFQRAVMFAMINPQPNGAGFAGVQTAMPSTAGSHSGDTGLRLQVRAQGQLKHWKLVLVDGDQAGSLKRRDYEQKFTLETDKAVSGGQFETVELPFADFKAYERGKLVPDAPSLDLTKTAIIGLQTFGGVYDTYKQEGTGSMEIDFIEFY